MVKRKAIEEHSGPGDDYAPRSPDLISPAKRRKQDDEERIDEVNALSAQDFQQQYIGNKSLSYSKSQHQDTNDYQITFKTSADLTKAEFDQCFNLIESTSRLDYEASKTFGWHPKRKKREMKEDEMRYLLVRSAPGTQDVLGFLSFMLTHDSTPVVPVLYIYEIHLSQALRGMGLGAYLMLLVQSIAARVEVAKVMLTCFLSNRHARDFYRGRGYIPDACSPEDRVTRKTVVEVDYIIMSKDAPLHFSNNASKGVLARTGDGLNQGELDEAKEDVTGREPSGDTGRRSSLEHKNRADIGESYNIGRDTAGSTSSKGWQGLIRSMVSPSANKENVV